MSFRCALVLPVAGLLLFGIVTYQSAHGYRSYHQYFWWSAYALDSDALDRRHWAQTPCPSGVEFYGEDCGQWGPSSIVVRQGWLSTILLFSALPAFLLGLFIVDDLAIWGVSGVTTFLVSMPILIVAWFYLVGWLIDRIVHKRDPASGV
jgi:hypothetical protein